MNITTTVTNNRAAAARTKSQAAAGEQEVAKEPQATNQSDSFEISISFDGRRIRPALEKLKSNITTETAALGITGVVGMGSLVGLAASGAGYGESLLGGVAVSAAVGISGALGYSKIGFVTNAANSLLLGYQVSRHLGVGPGLVTGLGLAAVSGYFTVKNMNKDQLSEVGGLIGTGLASANVGMLIAG